MKATEKKLSQSEERNASLMKRLQKLESKSVDPGGQKGEKACFICGGDHLARNCPKKKKGGLGGEKSDPIDLDGSE